MSGKGGRRLGWRRRFGRGSVRLENGDDGCCEVCYSAGDESNFIVLKLMDDENGEYGNITDDGMEEMLTLDILMDANTSSLNEIENVLVC